MIGTTEPIAFVEKYRGVGIHADQGPERILIVKTEIDTVLGLSDLGTLFEFALDAGHAPEARLLASALVEARWRLAAEERRARPDVDLEVLHATTGCLAHEYWRDPDRYGSLFDHGAVRREIPLENL